MNKVFPALVLLVGSTLHAAAQEQPGRVNGGEASVTVEGRPTATQGTATNESVITGGSPDVFINGKPAARVGDTTACGGKVVAGSSTVMVNGNPLAASGGAVSACPE